VRTAGSGYPPSSAEQGMRVTDRNTRGDRAAVTDTETTEGGRHPGGEVLVQLRVDATPDAVPRARRALGTQLACAAEPVRELAGDVKLLVGELLTNAVLHGTPPVDLRILARRGCLRVEVMDTSRVAPLRARSSADTMTGRGLALVAGLAARWGSQVHGDGKVVWAELDLAPASAPDGPPAQPTAPAEGVLDPSAQRLPPPADPGQEPRYLVSLGDISTDLLLAAKSHVDNLIREFALAASGATSGETSAIPPRLAELISQMTTRFAEARRMIREQALAAAAAGQRRTRLELLLPASAADAGEDYLAALDVADEYARQARLLTLETPPEHWAFRRWYVSSLVAQLRAASRGQPAPSQPSFKEYLRAGERARERRGPAPGPDTR